MRIFLGLSAVLAALFGAALLLAPGGFYAPTGIHLTPLAATIAQAHGATLLGVAVINWLSRRSPPSGARAVLAGNLVLQVLSLGVALRTMSLGAGAAVAPAIVVHVTLGALFALFLARSRPARARQG